MKGEFRMNVQNANIIEVSAEVEVLAENENLDHYVTVDEPNTQTVFID